MSTTIQSVLSAGEAAGYWRALPAEYDPAKYPHMQHFRTVEDGAGRRFNVYHAARDGKVKAGVAELSENPQQRGMRAHPADAHEAACGDKREPETVARELARRVLSNPAAQAEADGVRAALRERIAAREALRAHVATLQAQGWRLLGRGDPNPTVADDEHHEARLYGPHGLSARVTAGGKLYVERLTIDASDAAALVALAGAAA